MKRINTEFYVRILHKHIPEVKTMLGDEFWWQQDNDPKYTSHLTTTFLRENVLEVMDWPSYSPNLNLIENLWAIIKRNVERRMPRNLDELEWFMKKEWHRIPKAMLKYLVDSMRDWCQEVLNENDETISY
jgi:hypothetical protein